MVSPITFVGLVLLLGEEFVGRICAVSADTIAASAAHLAAGRKVNAIKVIYDELRIVLPVPMNHLTCVHKLITSLSEERSNKKAAAFLVRFHKLLVKLS